VSVRHALCPQEPDPDAPTRHNQLFAGRSESDHEPSHGCPVPYVNSPPFRKVHVGTVSLTMSLHPQRIGSSILVGFRTRFSLVRLARQLTVVSKYRGARLGCEHRRLLHITASSPHRASNRHGDPRRSSLRTASPRPCRSHGLGSAGSISHDGTWRGWRKPVGLYAQLDSSRQC
jgi:hypothetical protein